MKLITSIFLALFVSIASANPIDDACPQHVVWGAPQIPLQFEQQNMNQYLCSGAYAVNYNYKTKVSYFAVEQINANNLVKAAPRKDDFREDPRVPPQYRSTLKDYVGSGYDRGHIAPAADMPYSVESMSESFFLTNMMPQVPGNNRGIWKYTEELTRYYAQKYGQVYVITGTIFDPRFPMAIGNNVQVPTYVWKIIIDPRNVRSIAFLYPNQKLDPKDIEKYIVSIGEIEDFTGINISPKLPPEYAAMEKNRAIFKDW